jgi:hypothetical protein
MVVLIGILVYQSFTSLAYADTRNPIFDDRPISLNVVSGEYFSGVTQGGHTFSQQRVVTDTSVRIHKFVIADQFFYMSDRGFIEAENDLSAISIYLALLG